MPKETGRTRKIKTALAELLAEQSIWTVRQLRQACLGKFDVADDKDRQRYKDSIRRQVSLMQEQGELIAVEDNGIMLAPTGEKMVGETAGTAELPSDADMPETGLPEAPEPTHAEVSVPEENPTEEARGTEQSAPAPAIPAESAPVESVPTDAPVPEAVSGNEETAMTAGDETAVESTAQVSSIRPPKAKHMIRFLDDMLKSDAYQTEEQIIGAAIDKFQASGKQTNGVKGLVVQVLKERVKKGELEFSRETGYRMKDAEASPAVAAEPSPTEQIAPMADAPSPLQETPLSGAEPPRSGAEPPRSGAEPKQETPAPAVTPKHEPVQATQPFRESTKPQVIAEPVPLKPAPNPRQRNRRTDQPERRSQARRIEPVQLEKPGVGMNENRYAEKLNKCGGAFFTEYIARLFEAHCTACRMTVCGRYVVDGSDDKGVDVVLQTVDEIGLGDTILLQAKTRSSGQVTLKELREFFGVMSAEHATRGIFVTTSTFTTDAIAFVRNNPNLAAVDKYKLFDLARAHRIGLVSDGELLTADPALFS